MKRGNVIPGKRDKKWVLLFFPAALIFFAMLASLSAAVLKVRLGGFDLLIMAAMALIAAAAVCGFGYAGLKIAFACTLAGVAAGIILMVYVFCQPVEWAGIVGLVSCAQAAFLFFLAGINLQMIWSAVRKRREVSWMKK